MKSYESHLIDTKSFGEKKRLDYRPTMRSSAIFPLIIKKGKIESIYTFMGYWLRKRNISIVTVLFTMRDEQGKKLNVISREIVSSKSYVVSSRDLFSDDPENFIGSVEIEIFSAVDMVFPYPAITFALKSIHGLTFVHTCGRVYNDFDDLKSNNEIVVPETGFDILLGKDYKPFFSFVNGPTSVNSIPYEMEFIDQQGNRIIQKKELTNIPPYGLAWIEIFDKNINSDNFNGKKIAVKIKHNFKGFFPRFVAGNIFKDYSDISLTHSYYDNSVDKSPSSIFLNPSKKNFYDSVVAIPFDTKFDEIELAIYPNFSLSPCSLSFELFDLDGNFLQISNKKISIADGSESLIYIPILEMFKKLEPSVHKGMVRVIADGNGVVPTRMKFGLNFSKPKGSVNLPSNICFNANVPNEKLINKQGAFKWCPIFDATYQRIYLHNTSFVKQGFGSANIDIEVCRVFDDEKIIWSIELSQNGTIEIVEKKSQEIKNFLNGSIGWVAIQCSKPFVSGYYIADYENGVIGADHLY
jgi:hypothetical protein